eukprot:2240530-Alexandrium_andersonii.AAC.1
MGKGRGDGHYRDAEAEKVIPVVEADYTFTTANFQPAKDGDDATVKVVTILAAKDSGTGAVVATQCQHKGPADKFAVAYMARWLE